MSLLGAKIAMLSGPGSDLGLKEAYAARGEPHPEFLAARDSILSAVRHIRSLKGDERELGTDRPLTEDIYADMMSIIKRQLDRIHRLQPPSADEAA